MQMDRDKKDTLSSSFLLLEAWNGFMSIHGTSCEVVAITKPLLNSCHLQPDPVVSHFSCFQIFLDTRKDKKPAEGGLREERACSQSEGSIPSHDGVKEQALSSQPAFVRSSSPQLKAKCSICMAGKTKAMTTALRRTSHRGYGLGGLVSISTLFKNQKYCLLAVKSTISCADSSG